jgi:hypothetical protein
MESGVMQPLTDKKRRKGEKGKREYQSFPFLLFFLCPFSKSNEQEESKPCI